MILKKTSSKEKKSEKSCEKKSHRLKNNSLNLVEFDVHG